MLKYMVGGNQIPSNDIQIQRLLLPGAEQQRYISFSSPILVRYQQPLQVTSGKQCSYCSSHQMGQVATDVRTVRVVITLMGQNEIIKNIGGELRWCDKTPNQKILTTVHDFPVDSAAFGTATTLAGGTSYYRQCFYQSI